MYRKNLRKNLSFASKHKEVAYSEMKQDQNDRYKSIMIIRERMEHCYPENRVYFFVYYIVY